MAEMDAAMYQFERTGACVNGRRGSEVDIDCPVCGKGNEHCHANLEKRVFGCFHCGAGGTWEDLLDLTNKNNLLSIDSKEIAQLAKARGLPIQAFAGYEIGFVDGDYWIPISNASGRCVDLRHYRLGGKWMSFPTCKTGLFGAQHFNDPHRAGHAVFVCEGEFDAIALEWVRRKAGYRAIVVAVPGANTFKARWIPWLRGRDVVLFYDNDDAGASGELKAYRALRSVANSVRCLQWRDEPREHDINDLIRSAL